MPTPHPSPASYPNVVAVGGGQNDSDYTWSNPIAGATLVDVGPEGAERRAYLASSCYGSATASVLGQAAGGYFVMAQGTSLLVPIAVGQFIALQVGSGFVSPFPDYI